jgi:hypothetical protein
MSDSEDELSIKEEIDVMSDAIKTIEERGRSESQNAPEKVDEVQGPPSDSDDDLPIPEVMRKRIIKIEKRKLAEKERDTKSSPSSSSDLKAVKRRK